MFDASGLPVWRHTARCESEASRASYASQRKLDKRIILIALAQRFPSSRSTWWSARSPPCYSPCASQVSTCMSVFISQVALACFSFFFFLPSPLFFLLAVPRCEWDQADLSLCAVYQWIVAITKLAQVEQKKPSTCSVIKYVISMQLSFLSHLQGILHRTQYRGCKYSLDWWYACEILA